MVINWGLSINALMVFFVIPVQTGIQYPKYWFPAFAGTTSGFLLEFTPYSIRGRND
jgi:hypothetical protein